MWDAVQTALPQLADPHLTDAKLMELLMQPG